MNRAQWIHYPTLTSWSTCHSRASAVPHCAFCYPHGDCLWSFEVLKASRPYPNHEKWLCGLPDA